MAYKFVSDILPKDLWSIKCPHSMTPEFIVVHNTSNDASAENEIAHIKNPLTSHYVDTNLTPEKEYSYYFYVLGKDRYSNRSDIVKIKTSYIEPVANLYASNDYSRKVKLLWNPHQRYR